MDLVIATKNKGKLLEIKDLLKDFPIRIKNLDDFGPIPPVIEDGKTFDDNAFKKASFTARVLGVATLAEDSGLVVDALDGAPGVLSARFAKEDAKDLENNEKLLSLMKNKKNRNAHFQTVISIATPTGYALTYEGICKGTITEKPIGENGFGYDPLFFYTPLNKTFGQINIKEKNKISHRGKAFKELIKEFDKVLIWLEQNMPKFEKIKCVK